MISKKQKILITAISLVAFSFLSFAYAMETDLPQIGGTKPDETTKLPDYINYLFNFAIAIAGIVALGVIVWSGIKILMSPDQPETKKDARSKITGALLGIIILLASYLILTTINPQLAFIGFDKDLKPVSGIYLIKGEEREYVASDVSRIAIDGATTLEFLSTKDELISVFVYSEEDFKGTETEIKNPKENQDMVTQSSVGSPKSVILLWNRPGIYLYPETNYRGRPRYFNTGVSSLADYAFDKKTKSIRFVNALYETQYGAIFFTRSDSRGYCGFFSAREEIPDLSVSNDSYRHAIGNLDGGLSSFILFNTLKSSPGMVEFFSNTSCTGDSAPITLSTASLKYNPSLSKAFYSDDPSKPIQNNIMSFQINGNFGVLLTQYEDFGGRCQFFMKPSGSNCYSNIQSTYLWEETEWGGELKTGSWVIVPLGE